MNKRRFCMDKAALVVRLVGRLDAKRSAAAAGFLGIWVLEDKAFAV